MRKTSPAKTLSQPALRLSRIALTAVLITVCSWLSIPVLIPFSLQTFAVFFALLFLGGRDGTFAIGLYLILGLIGLPVFTGFRGGAGHLLGPTGGYLIGFLGSGLVYLIFTPLIRRKKGFRWAALLAGLLLCYLFGTVWFAWVYSGETSREGLLHALELCVVPYILPDLAKLVLAVFISGRIQRILNKTGEKS